MKKMLDELKKLDTDYSVPVDFKKNVMAKIREINEHEKKQHRERYITKYVIPCIASAAVILIVCIVTIRGDFRSKSADMSLNSVAQNLKTDGIVEMTDTSEEIQNASEEDSQSNKLKNDELDIFKENFNTRVDGVQKDDVIASLAGQKFDSLNESSVDEVSVPNDVVMSNNIELGKEGDMAKVDLTADSVNSEFHEIEDNTILLNEIKTILTENEIEILENTEKYIIVDANIEKINEVLKEFEDNITLIQEDNMVKIEY